MRSTTSPTIALAFIFTLSAAPSAHAEENWKLQNLNYWMTAQAGYFGCAEAALKGVIVQKFNSKRYEVAATTMGDEVAPTHVILKTRNTEFTSRGEVVICVSKKYGSQKVKTNDGFSDTWMVVTEGELNGTGKAAKRMNEEAESKLSGAAKSQSPTTSRDRVSAKPDDSKGPALIQQAKKLLAAGDKEGARSALKSAQRLGWNDLDLANALSHR